MHRLPVVAVQVFQFKRMDQTLKDYIDRTMKRLEEEKLPSKDPKENQYPIAPEDDGYDTFKNPYGQH